MPSSRQPSNQRRQTYLALAGSIESQLRDAFAKRYEAGLETQSSLATKLGVGRSTINKRLTGQHNLTIKTISELLWGLGHGMKVTVFDCHDHGEKNFQQYVDLNKDLIPSGSSAPTVIAKFEKVS